LVHASPHDGVLCVYVCGVEDCDMETVKDPIVLQLELEYKFLKVALEKENNKFELIRKQHARTVSQLADDITRKFFEYQAAKIEAKRYLEEQYKNYQENANE
jgi:hypothetical protein